MDFLSKNDKIDAMKLADREFDRIVEEAVKLLPEEIRQHLQNIVISVRRRPSKSLLKDMGVPRDETLLGLFQGVPLIERSVTSPPLYPDTILLFQEPLEEMCDTVEDLERQIGITVVHEVAHFVGMDEARVEELGYR